MTDEGVSTCQGCGAAIYPEHLDSGIAGYLAGRLLCPHCLTEGQKEQAAIDEAELSPISFDDDESTVDMTKGSQSHSTSIHGFSGDSLASQKAIYDDSKYNRMLEPTSPTAMRCRTFHSKLNDGAVAYMNDQINTWVDSDPKIGIKFATSTIGVFEGKQKDPHLIMTIFY